VPQSELAQNVESKAGLSSAGSADIAANAANAGIAGNAESGGNAALPRTVGRKPRRFGYATLFVMHPDAPGLSHVPASSCKYLNSKYHDWRDRPDRFMIKSPASKAVSKRRIDINENPARDRLVNQIRDWPYGGELIETGRFLFRSA
jgi:hypothetical protein